MYFGSLLNRFTEMSKSVFGENLVGVYLHGSLAMNCFNPEKSDLDLILVVEKDISDAEKVEFLRRLMVLNEEAPRKGFELSIVKREVCAPFVYPTPFEFHFSAGHLAAASDDPQGYIERMKGTDKDLGAHFTIINHFGVPLYGPQVKDVFAPVPKKDYFDSIWFDVENARTDILDSPMYITLNLCRVLGYVCDGYVLSKKSGGEWGMHNLPEKFRMLIWAALQAYLLDTEMEIDQGDLLHFAEFMIDEIKRIWTEDPENVTPAMLTDMGICPTCYNREHNYCFFSEPEKLLLYENALFTCELVDKPRAVGHAVIASKAHYKDMMDIPDDLCSAVYVFAKKAMQVIKSVYGAESVYLCTMCDGPMNHFHVQLIPRYANEKRGSMNFVKARNVYIEDVGKTDELRRRLSAVN